MQKRVTGKLIESLQNDDKTIPYYANITKNETYIRILQ